MICFYFIERIDLINNFHFEYSYYNSLLISNLVSYTEPSLTYATSHYREKLPRSHYFDHFFVKYKYSKNGILHIKNTVLNTNLTGLIIRYNPDLLNIRTRPKPSN